MAVGVGGCVGVCVGERAEVSSLEGKESNGQNRFSALEGGEVGG